MEKKTFEIPELLASESVDFFKVDRPKFSPSSCRYVVDIRLMSKIQVYHPLHFSTATRCLSDAWDQLWNEGLQHCVKLNGMRLVPPCQPLFVQCVIQKVFPPGDAVEELFDFRGHLHILEVVRIIPRPIEPVGDVRFRVTAGCENQ